MKKLFLHLLFISLLVTGCSPNESKDPDPVEVSKKPPIAEEYKGTEYLNFTPKYETLYADEEKICTKIIANLTQDVNIEFLLDETYHDVYTRSYIRFYNEESNIAIDIWFESTKPEYKYVDRIDILYGENDLGDDKNDEYKQMMNRLAESSYFNNSETDVTKAQFMFAEGKNAEFITEKDYLVRYKVASNVKMASIIAKKY